MRHFTPEPIEPAVLQKLTSAARQAPSVGYMQPWSFIRITEAALRQGIYRMVEAGIAETAGLPGMPGDSYSAAVHRER